MKFKTKERLELMVCFILLITPYAYGVVALGYLIYEVIDRKSFVNRNCFIDRVNDLLSCAVIHIAISFSVMEILGLRKFIF